MPDLKRLIGLLLAVTVVVVVFGPIATAVQDNVGTQSVTNESVTADLGNEVDLSGYNIDASSVTVYNATDDVVPASEYTINDGPGTINVSSTSTSVSDGETIAVSYDYQATTGMVTTIVGYVPELVAVLILAFLGLAIQDHM